MVELFSLPIDPAEFWRWTMIAGTMLALGFLIRRVKPDFVSSQFFIMGGGIGLSGMALVALTGGVAW